MSIPHVFTATPALVGGRVGADKVVTQIYRCGKGHITAIHWDARDVSLAIKENDFKFYCPRCDSSRLASLVETNAILAALGLPAR